MPDDEKKSWWQQAVGMMMGEKDKKKKKNATDKIKDTTQSKNDALKDLADWGSGKGG